MAHGSTTYHGHATRHGLTTAQGYVTIHGSLQTEDDVFDAAAGLPGALSAPTLTRTSAVTAYPPTADFTRPVDWQDGDTAVMQRSQDPTFATGVTEVTQVMAGGTTTYNFGMSSVVSGVWYFRMAAWTGTRPGSLFWSNIIGVGDAVAPTITSTNAITLANNTSFNLSLTANETVTWAITGGTDASKYSLTGSTLTCSAQTVSGSYAVEITATDLCGNATVQTVTATLLLPEWASGTNKNPNLTLSGTPKLTGIGTATVNAMQNTRSLYLASGKRVWEWTPNLSGTFAASFGFENAASDFAGAFPIVGWTTTTGISLYVDNSSWLMNYGGVGGAQANYSSGHVNGDTYAVERDDTMGGGLCAFSFFRTRSGVRTQLGTTVTGLSNTFKYPFGGTRDATSFSANFGQSAFAAAPTAGFSAYNA